MAAVKREMVLYYQPARQGGGLSVNDSKAARLKGVLVRMGVRIRNVTSEQVTQKVGYLAGLDGFGELGLPQELPFIDEEVMVLKNFSDKRLDELLAALRRAGVPKVELKAVLTPTNSQWTWVELYEELKKERKVMNNPVV